MQNLTGMMIMPMIDHGVVVDCSHKMLIAVSNVLNEILETKPEIFNNILRRTFPFWSDERKDYRYKIEPGWRSYPSYARDDGVLSDTDWMIRVELFANSQMEGEPADEIQFSFHKLHIIPADPWYSIMYHIPNLEWNDPNDKRVSNIVQFIPNKDGHKVLQTLHSPAAHLTMKWLMGDENYDWFMQRLITEIKETFGGTSNESN